MKNSVYLGFINNYFPPLWQNLEKDLSRIIPYPYTAISLEIEMNSFYSSKRNQYNSSFILSEVIDRLPKDGEKIIGITDVDIYIPILTFLFGEAQLSGKGALVSTHRLQSEFYGLPRDDKLLYERILKEVIAEVSAQGPKDLGKVMKAAMPRIAGKAQGKEVNEIARRLLS